MDRRRVENGLTWTPLKVMGLKEIHPVLKFQFSEIFVEIGMFN